MSTHCCAIVGLSPHTERNVIKIMAQYGGKSDEKSAFKAGKYFGCTLLGILAWKGRGSGIRLKKAIQRGKIMLLYKRSSPHAWRTYFEGCFCRDEWEKRACE